MEARFSPIICLIVIAAIVASSTTASAWMSGVSWYQGPRVRDIVGMYADFVVVDPDYGPGDAAWSSSDIAWIKASGVKVIAYLNIGFAEEWRDYWNESWSSSDHPEWLEWVEYPGWPGEYFVKYWHPSAWEPGGWVDILKAEIDKIIAMGFDGVRLDNIDSYTYWEDPDSIGLGGVLPQVDNASTWMIYLVGNLSSYAKAEKPGFLVFANMGGGLELLGNESFLSSIDVVEREEVWYGGNAPVDPAETSEALYWLRYAKSHGKHVFVMDYAWSPGYVEDALSKAEAEGFYIYVAPSYDLDRLPGYLPVYRGIDADGLLVTWGYHGVADSSWRLWDIYVGHYNGSGVSTDLVVDEDYDIDPHIAVLPGGAVVTYTSNETTGYMHVRAAFIDTSTMSILDMVTVASAAGSNVYGGDIAYSEPYIYVSYIDEASNDLYVALLDPVSHSVAASVRVTNTPETEEYPVMASVPGGAVVAWRSSDGALHLALITSSTVAWSTDVDTGVDPYRYAVAYVEDKGILVIYSAGGTGHAKLYDTSGNTVDSASGLPQPSWLPSVLVVNNTVAYTGVSSINYLLIGSIALIQETPVDQDTSAGSALLLSNGNTVLVTPSKAPGNTLTVSQELAVPSPVPEPATLPLVILGIVLAVLTRRLLYEKK